QVHPQLAQAVGDAVESGHAQPIDPEVVQNAPDLGPKKKWCSAVVVPLIARDTPLGAIVCCAARRQFEPADLALIENLAARAATAPQHSHLFRTSRAR